MVNNLIQIDVNLSLIFLVNVDSCLDWSKEVAFNRGDMSLFFNKESEDGRYEVYTASEEEIQKLYDCSIDVFHNLNSLG